MGVPMETVQVKRETVKVMNVYVRWRTMQVLCGRRYLDNEGAVWEEEDKTDFLCGRRETMQVLYGRRETM